MRHVHARAADERLALAWHAEERKVGVEAVGGARRTGRGQEVARSNLVGGHGVQVEGDAVPGVGAIDGLAVHLHAAHARAQAGGQHLHLVARPGRPAPQGARDHGPGAFDAEHAVDGQAQARARLRAPRGARRACQSLLQLGKPGGRAAGHGDDIGIRERRAGQAAPHLVGHEQRPFLVHEVGFRERHHAGAYAQKLQHGQVLLGLRHDAVVGGDAKKRQVDARRSRYHLAHEALVARHVHHAEHGAVRKRQAREAQLDGDAALLLLCQTVGVGSGQGQHERRLAVVDMAGRAQHEVGLRVPAHARLPSAPASSASK